MRKTVYFFFFFFFFLGGGGIGLKGKALTTKFHSKGMKHIVHALTFARSRRRREPRTWISTTLGGPGKRKYIGKQCLFAIIV